MRDWWLAPPPIRSGAKSGGPLVRLGDHFWQQGPENSGKFWKSLKVYRFRIGSKVYPSERAKKLQNPLNSLLFEHLGSSKEINSGCTFWVPAVISFRKSLRKWGIVI